MMNFIIVILTIFTVFVIYYSISYTNFLYAQSTPPKWTQVQSAIKTLNQKVDGKQRNSSGVLKTTSSYYDIAKQGYIRFDADTKRWVSNPTPGGKPAADGYKPQGAQKPVVKPAVKPVVEHPQSGKGKPIVYGGIKSPDKKPKIISIGGSQGPVILQYTNGGVKISPDGTNIISSINPSTPDGVGWGDKQRNEISFDMYASGAISNTDNGIINTFQLKPPGSEYGAMTIGIKDGKYAIKIGGADSIQTDIKADRHVQVDINVKNGKGELYLNGVKQSSGFNVPTSSNIKFGLEGSDNVNGTILSKYDEITIS
jgi:hypothetical protein